MANKSSDDTVSGGRPAGDEQAAGGGGGSDDISTEAQVVVAAVGHAVQVGLAGHHAEGEHVRRRAGAGSGSGAAVPPAAGGVRACLPVANLLEGGIDILLKTAQLVELQPRRTRRRKKRSAYLERKKEGEDIQHAIDETYDSNGFPTRESNRTHSVYRNVSRFAATDRNSEEKTKWLRKLERNVKERRRRFSFVPPILKHPMQRNPPAS
uniref:Uncharacterized protein n=1 Tax=Oryza glumipatula TaxID=40148 RepID=A0A0E0AEA4_9ORYZ